MIYLVSVLAFIAAIGILVTVHEFGHFWVAKKLGVKVLRFSIGFGKPLFTLRAGADKTEYVLASIPLGGYVKMLDEREGEVDPSELHRAFNRKSVWTRIAVVAAGPIFNFLFAIFAYWLMFMVGDETLKPYVGEVVVQTPAAQAGFEKRDLITSVDGQATLTWDDVRLAMLKKALDRQTLVVDVLDAKGNARVRTLDFSALQVLKKEGDFMRHIGLSAWTPSMPVIGSINPGGAAEKSGLRVGDRVLSVDGQAVTDTNEWLAMIHAANGKTLHLGIERDGQNLSLDLTPGAKRTETGKLIGFINAGINGYRTEQMKKQLFITVPYGPWTAFTKSLANTRDMTVVSLRLLGRLVMGEASVKNISGPVTIAEVAGLSALLGVAKFLSVLAIISISLGVLNLLPVPILDGGHLLYYAIELIKGSPVSEQVQIVGSWIGAVMIGALMMLAFYNDITRLLG